MSLLAVPPGVKRFASTAALLLFVLGLSGCGDNPDSEAAPLSVADFRGYTVFVNYWAEWCQPCREEIPELNDFQQRHADAVRVVGVNFDQLAGEALAAQEEALGIEFPTLDVDPRAVFNLPVPLGLPETFVLDEAGNLLDILQGVQTLESLEEALEMARLKWQRGEEG